MEEDWSEIRKLYAFHTHWRWSKEQNQSGFVHQAVCQGKHDATWRIEGEELEGEAKEFQDVDKEDIDCFNCYKKGLYKRDCRSKPKPKDQNEVELNLIAMISQEIYLELTPTGGGY